MSIVDYPTYENYEELIRNADHHGGGCNLDYDGCHEVVSWLAQLTALRARVAELEAQAEYSNESHHSAESQLITAIDRAEAAEAEAGRLRIQAGLINLAASPEAKPQTMRPQAYAASIVAIRSMGEGGAKQFFVSSRVISFYAPDPGTAQEIADKGSLKYFPPEKGYIEHRAVVSKVPEFNDEMVTKV